VRPLKRAVEAALGAFCVALIAALAVLVLAAVAFRQLGASLAWYDEVATVMLAWLTYYGAAYAALKRGHLGSPEVLMRLPRPWRFALFVLSEGLVVAFFAAVAWLGLEVVVLLKGDGLISLPWVPVQLTQSVIPIGCALFVVCQLLSARDEWAALGRDRAEVKEAI
jgi:TRAP-type C4-dicarboxylate transport system permease small subunit